MSEDPYSVLGVKKEATPDEIRAAYRKLAKTLHPDLNPGDRAAEEKFKAVAAAYDLVGDPEKRARYDRGEIDASGTERPRERYYRDFQGPGAEAHSYSTGSGFADFAETEDILREMFGRGAGGGRMRMRGQDVLYRLPVEFLEAVNGATKRITMPEGGTIDVTIPAGTRNEQICACVAKVAPAWAAARPGTPWCKSRCGRTSSSPARMTTSISSCRSACRRRCSEPSSMCRRRPARCA